MAPDPELLKDVVRRIVEAVAPEKIILFGSAARGEMNRHSDLDLLVVKAGGNPLDLMGDIYDHLAGVGAAVDAVVVSPETLSRYRDCHFLVYETALREGTVVHDTA